MKPFVFCVRLLPSLLMGFGVPSGAQSPDKPDEKLVWPNKESRANSDDWLRLHHHEIRGLRPRVLVLNFVNGLNDEEAKRRAEAVVSAMKEASRYHGYSDAKAVPFLEYQIAKVVNLTDEVALPDDQRKEGNSSKYPRIEEAQGGQNNFRYADLFTEKYTELMDFADPLTPTRRLSLAELAGRGLVHEVWIVANEGGSGKPKDCLELRVGYDANSRKVPGKEIVVGGEGVSDLPPVTRSLRFLHLNPARGAGRALESLGLSLEAVSEAKAVPSLTKYFTEFAGFNLASRYGLSFNRFEERGEREIEYQNESTLLYKVKGEAFRVSNYRAAGGSVRFAPNSRRDFDLDNKDPVLSTIENFRLKNGTNGRDKADKWTPEKVARYGGTAPDSVGAWLVYWFQSMPGLDNKAFDDTMRPMKNWWVYWYY